MHALAMRRSAVAVAAGSAALMAWGMVFWGALAPRLDMFHAVPNEPAITAALLDAGTPTGTYFAPWPRRSPQDFDRFVAHHRRGGFYMLSYIREGVDPQSAAKLTLGCLQYAGVATLAALLLVLAGPLAFRRRWALVVVAGSVGTLFTTWGNPIWFHLPWDHALGQTLYEAVSWVVLGAVMARMAPGLVAGR